jgi:NAD(P)-dependent dehydrogenase (short-subunit alcohol dehydrogenase family)
LHRGASGFGFRIVLDERGRDERRRSARQGRRGHGRFGRHRTSHRSAWRARAAAKCFCRDKAVATVAAVSSTAGVAADKLVACVCDLGNLESVREFTRFVRRADEAIDILICNAGVMALPQRTATRRDSRPRWPSITSRTTSSSSNCCTAADARQERRPRRLRVVDRSSPRPTRQ